MLRFKYAEGSDPQFHQKNPPSLHSIQAKANALSQFLAAQRPSLSLAVIQNCFVMLSYYFAGWVGILTAIPPGLASAVWPASGVAVGAILILGNRVWIGVLLGSFALNVTTLMAEEPTLSLSVLLALFIGLGSAAQGLLAAWLTKKFIGPSLFDRTINLLKFTVSSSISSIIAPTIASLALSLSGLIKMNQVRETWGTWWFGDLVGMLVVIPTIVMTPLELKSLRGHGIIMEVVCLCLLLAASCFIIFDRPFGSHHFPIGFIPLLFVIWAAFRTGYTGIFLSISIITAMAVSATVNGRGAFVSAELSRNASLIVLQSFIAFAALLGYSVVALVRERGLVVDALRRFKFIADNASEAEFLTDASGNIVYVNKMACKKLGYTEEELLAKQVPDIDPNFTEATVKEVVKNTSTQRLEPFETHHLRKDGSSFPVEISLSAYMFDGARYNFAIARDISERKQAEESLRNSELLLRAYAEKQARANALLEEQALTINKNAEELAVVNKNLEQFVSIASHDLKAPLRSISTYLSLLEKKAGSKLEEEDKNFITLAKDSAKSMQKLIDALLEYSRIGWDKSSLENINMTAIAERVLATLSTSIDENNIEIAQGVLPVIFGNSIQVEILLQNLLSNSIKFRRTHSPRIEICARETEVEWLFWVEDNGIGINSEFQESVFEVFRRLHAPNEYAGSGIGLATCRKIVEAHGGKIWLQSEEGAGTTVYFTIPKPRQPSALR